MSILVTGGAGYIGSHTALELTRQGLDVVIADNFCNSKPIAVERVGKLAGKNIPCYEVDLRDKEKLSAVFTKHDIDCVIHFAGLKAVGESVVKPLEYYTNNLNSTLTLCYVMRERGVKRIIFSSSATVYDGDNTMPLTESSKTGNCSNPYGWTKFMIERILTDMAAANENWSVVLLRYFNPLGADASGDIGEDPAGIPNNLMPFIAQTAVGRQKILFVFGDDYPTPDGTGVRDYIHVADLAKGHVAAIKYCESHIGAKAFNLGTGKGTSVFELKNAFEAVTGINIPYKVIPRRPGDLPVTYADPTLAKAELGWQAEKSIDEMCIDTWRWQKQNPMGFGESKTAS